MNSDLQRDQVRAMTEQIRAQTLEHSTYAAKAAAEIKALEGGAYVSDTQGDLNQIERQVRHSSMAADKAKRQAESSSAVSAARLADNAAKLAGEAFAADLAKRRAESRSAVAEAYKGEASKFPYELFDRLLKPSVGAGAESTAEAVRRNSEEMRKKFERSSPWWKGRDGYQGLSNGGN